MIKVFFVLVLSFVFAVAPVMGEQDCATIKDGPILDKAGGVIETGYDK